MTKAKNNNNHPVGHLIINVPHWLVRVHIYNNVAALIKTIIDYTYLEEIKEYQYAINLQPGIYEIQYLLGNISEKITMMVTPGKNLIQLEMQNRIRDKIENVAKFASALVKSLKRFNLIIQSDANSEDPPQFILRHQGKSVLKASARIVKTVDENILQTEYFLNTPSGSYIFEWNTKYRSKICQPIYLPAKYNAIVILLPDANRTGNIIYTLYKKGTKPKHLAECILATEIAMSDSRSDTHRGNQILISDNFLNLQLEDPWLVPMMMCTYYTTDLRNTKKQYSAEKLLKKQLLHDLSDHPDFQAVYLDSRKPTISPFKSPPMLRKLLKKIQAHANIRKSTVSPQFPELKSGYKLLPDGIWTAWTSEQNKTTDQVTGSSPSWPEITIESYTGYIPPKLPIFQLPESYDITTRYFTSDEFNSDPKTLEQALTINLSQDIFSGTYIPVFSNEFTLGTRTSLTNYLNTVSAAKISIATAQSVPAIRTSLKGLKNKSTDQSWFSKPLDPNEQSIIKFAIEDISKKTQTDISHQELESLSTIPPEELETNTLTIEDCVSQLSAEIDRLYFGFDVKMPPTNQNRKYIDRLIHISKKLIRGAEFIAKTNEEGKLVQVNGAFLYLLYPKSLSEIKGIPNEGVENQTRIWEKNLRSLSVGQFVTDLGIENDYFDVWHINKISLIVKDPKRFIGFIYILRGKTAPQFTDKVMSEIENQIRKLTLFIPSYVLEIKNGSNSYKYKIEEALKNIEELLESGTNLQVESTFTPVPLDV